MQRTLTILIFIALAIIVMLGGFAVGQLLLSKQQQPLQRVSTVTPTTTTFKPGKMAYVQGSQLIDASGHPFVLHGAQIESSLIFANSWGNPRKSPTTILNSKTFQVMAQDWKMNALRLPLSNWLYAKDTANYMNIVDQVIQEANAAGLYVVIDLHDNAKSGSPYGPGSDLPKTEDITFWKAIATHFKDNSMVMFDVFNEPKARDWQTWLHGGGTIGGTKIVGFQDLVDAVRSVGAKQIIVVEPGSIAGGPDSVGGWSTIGNNTIKDPNIVYSLHIYSSISLPPNQQDAKWGPILNHYPIYYGEWAFLPNSFIPIQCRSVPHDQADQVVSNFLQYMASRHASWTAWSFTPMHLIQDTSSFTPTTLDIPWTCGDTSIDAGMGEILKHYLTIGS
jgi:hypothetical protein